MRPLVRDGEIMSITIAWKLPNDNAPDGRCGEENAVVRTRKVALLVWGTNVWDTAEKPLLDKNLKEC